MAENLAYLPSVNNVADGSEDTGKEQKPFYYVYDYDGTDVSTAKATSYYEQYGVLYNWIAAQSACPDGWHLPTDEEWNELEISLGVSSNQTSVSGFHGTDQGSRLKSTWDWAYHSWKDRYGNGSNETGFTALPGGGRFIDYSSHSLDTYTFGGLGDYGYWWTASKESGDEYSGTYMWFRALFYYSDQIYRNKESEKEAYSMRCIKN